MSPAFVDKLEKFGVIEEHLGDNVIRSRVDFLFQIFDVTSLVGSLVMFFRVSGNSDAEVRGNGICQRVIQVLTVVHAGDLFNQFATVSVSTIFRSEKTLTGYGIAP